MATLWLARNDVADAADVPNDDSSLTLSRIFRDHDFDVKSFGPHAWLDDGDAYTTVEADRSAATESGDRQETGDNSRERSRDDDGGDKVIVRYETGSGARSILVGRDALCPEGEEEPLEIEAYDWSHDHTKLLIFTNTQKVWRDNTRGDYWVLDIAQSKLRQIGRQWPPQSLMFAKFSSSADRVAYVHENNIYVEALETGSTIQLTSDGTEKVINGTFDWVYEEEFGLQDGFQLSPDKESRWIAYWQLDATDIRDFYLLNNTDEIYPRLTKLPYPKAGTSNSACRIGVVPTAGGMTTWLDIPGDPAENYLVSLNWLEDGRHLLVEQLNRLQNRRTLWSIDAERGEVRSIVEENDAAWIDVRSRFDGSHSPTERIFLSERDGWRHAYRVRLRDGQTELLTPGDYDVIELLGSSRGEREGRLSARGGWLYFTASPNDPIRQYLYRVPLSGGLAERVTPLGKGEDGFHEYDLAENGRWAIHTFSTLDTPKRIQLVSLPSHKVLRVLESNDAPREAIRSLRRGALKFFRTPVKLDAETARDTAADPKIRAESSDDSFLADGWMLLPPNFDDSKKYPVVCYVYTEPWGQTARDQWGRERFLWHLLLSQKGYVVVTLDNRGTPAPRGRVWRKSIYGKIGRQNVRDQAEGLKQILHDHPFLDQDRVGIWGWSGGGTSTLNAMFQHPDLYHVGIAVAPVGKLALYDTIYQERYMGLPTENREGYRDGSPATHAKNLRGKLLLIHGTGDDNVHYQNAEVVINELIRNNRPFDMMAYPNRTHAIKEGENTQLHLFELMTRFLELHLPACAG